MVILCVWLLRKSCDTISLDDKGVFIIDKLIQQNRIHFLIHLNWKINERKVLSPVLRAIDVWWRLWAPLVSELQYNSQSPYRHKRSLMSFNSLVASTTFLPPTGTIRLPTYLNEILIDLSEGKKLQPNQAQTHTHTPMSNICQDWILREKKEEVKSPER